MSRPLEKAAKIDSSQKTLKVFFAGSYLEE